MIFHGPDLMILITFDIQVTEPNLIPAFERMYNSL